MSRNTVSTLSATILGVVGILVAAFLFLIWRGSRLPMRPADISSKGVFLEVGAVPFKFSTHGDWLDCWEDTQVTMDRCKYTDEKGKVLFEDFVLPYQGTSPVPEDQLAIDVGRSRSFHYGVTDKNIRFPLIYLRNGEILLPQSDYEWGRKIVDYWVTHKSEKEPSR